METTNKSTARKQTGTKSDTTHTNIKNQVENKHRKHTEKLRLELS